MVQSSLNTLEAWVKSLSEKMDNKECQNQKNILRLVGLPEKAEGQDLCTFLGWRGHYESKELIRFLIQDEAIASSANILQDHNPNSMEC